VLSLRHDHAACPFERHCEHPRLAYRQARLDRHDDFRAVRRDIEHATVH
jgi:hypothetical protein